MRTQSDETCSCYRKIYAYHNGSNRRVDRSPFTDSDLISGLMEDRTPGVGSRNHSNFNYCLTRFASMISCLKHTTFKWVKNSCIFSLVILFYNKFLNGLNLSCISPETFLVLRMILHIKRRQQQKCYLRKLMLSCPFRTINNWFILYSKEFWWDLQA